MGNLESKLHTPGVMICRAKGNLTADDLEKWREELVKFVKEHHDKGVCGMLIDACQVDGLAVDSIDALLELLTDPEEIIRDVKMRFAFVGVKPFTQRFLRETMPLEEVKHIRARFFHEVSEGEALAWLQAMVSSADDAPERKADSTEPAASKPADTKKEPPKTESPKAEPKKTGPLPKPPAEKAAETPAKKPDILKQASEFLKGKEKPKS